MSSVSTYTDAAYSSKGFTSMVSGLDTEGLVKSMLSGIQTKIDKQNQVKQQLLWKQEMYRDVITNINNFQNKYFSLTSQTSLRSNSLFNSIKTSSDSKAVSVSSANPSAIGNTSIQVARLATATSLTSQKVSAAIKLDSSSFSFDRSVTFNVGDSTYDVDLSGAETASDAADRINAALSEAGITASVGENGELTLSGSDDFSVSGSSLGLNMLGLSDGAASKDGSLIGKEYNGSALPSITISLSGVSKTFELSEENTMQKLQDSVKSSFGSSITFSQEGDVWSISSGAGQSVTISDKDGGLAVLGLEHSVSSRVITSQAIGTQNLSQVLTLEEGEDKYRFTINGTEFEFDSTATVNEIMQQINNSDAGVSMKYNELSDTFSLTRTETGNGFDIEIEDTSGNMLSAIFGGSTKSLGQNALFTVDGTMVERTSNSFTVNSMSMTLNDVTGNYLIDESGNYLTNPDGTFKLAEGAFEQKAQLSAARDTTKITDTIKSFVEDYNKLIEDLNKKIHEEAKYKSYLPLTDEQKSSMKDSEIENWEKASKTGLLSRDPDISSFLSSMRNAISTNTGTKYVLSQIGIDTSSEWTDYGKLIINEDELTKALENDATGVAEVFAGPNGLASRLNNVAGYAANTSSGRPGSLVALAGVVGKATEKSNTINSQLNSIASKVERLKNQYEMQKSRYWSQFNAMEKALSNMTTTSSFLTSMLGG